MALTLQQVRTLPAFADMSDKDIINHAKAHGFDTSAMQPETSNDEAGAIRSYGTIPLLKGVADVGGGRIPGGVAVRAGRACGHFRDGDIACG